MSKQARGESYRYATQTETRSQVSKLEEPYVGKAHKTKKDIQRALEELRQEILIVLLSLSS